MMKQVGSTEYGEKAKAVLDNLNPHKFTSQIPVRSQGNRRNSTNTGLTDMINKSIDRNSLNGSRKKMLVTDVNEGFPGGFRLSQRYSSLPSNNNTNHSLAGLTDRSDGLGLGSQHGSSNRDPRPLRDRNFQNAIQQEIFDYLSQHRFELETNLPISLKFLKQPTQKGFVIIFKWLYLRLDPGYVFLKSFEHEVYQVLKTLQYPYLETINKSQISAVGGSSWPKFLGMIHWLVRINLKLDQSLNKLDQNIINQNTQELTILNHPLKSLDEQDQKQEKYELMVEKLFIEYVIDSYKSFLKLEDDYSPYMEELQLGFNKFTHIIETDISNLGAQNEKLYVDCQERAKRNEKIGIATAKCKALKSDLTKFQNYVNTMESKSHEWPTKLEKMKHESSSKNEQIYQLEEKVHELKDILSRKGVSMASIDEKIKVRETINSELDSTSEQLDHLVGLIKSERHQTESIAANMMSTVRQYNSAIVNLINSFNQHGENIDESLFKINIREDVLEEKTEAIKYDSLLPPGFTIKETLKEDLSKLYHHIEGKVIKAQEKNSFLEKHLMDLRELINEKTNYIGSLELELSKANSDYELTMQESESSMLSQKIEIEKLKKKIQDSRDIVQEKVSEAEQLLENKKLQYEELLLNVNRQRISLHAQVIEIIEYASNFKITIQGMLENAENDINMQNAAIEQY